MIEAEWLDAYNVVDGWLFKCSHCKRVVYRKTERCPSCEARMLNFEKAR